MTHTTLAWRLYFVKSLIICLSAYIIHYKKVFHANWPLFNTERYI